MTREEEIRQAVEEIYSNMFDDGLPITYGEMCAQWADEHPKNSWRDAEHELPEHEKEVIGLFADGSICSCKCSPEERIWFIGMICTDAPIYWMPIPETPKGE